MYSQAIANVSAAAFAGASSQTPRRALSPRATIVRQHSLPSSRWRASAMVHRPARLARVSSRRPAEILTTTSPHVSTRSPRRQGRQEGYRALRREVRPPP